MTADLYKSNKLEFFGKYAEFRKMMDYTYHNNYVRKRQIFQDTIIDSYFKNIDETKNKSTLLYTCGSYGAGKSHVLRHLNYFDLTKSVYIDPDQLKYRLPEATAYIKQSPIKAGSLLHKESVYLALLIEYIALKYNCAIIVDGSMQDYEWYKKHIQWIKETYPKYIIGILKVDAKLDIIKERCKKRGLVTGRVIPEDVIEKIYENVPLSFMILQYYVDFYIDVTNNDKISINEVKFKETPDEKTIKEKNISFIYNWVNFG